MREFKYKSNIYFHIAETAGLSKKRNLLLGPRELINK